MMTADQIADGFLSFLTSKKLHHLLPEIVLKLSRFVEKQKETADVTSAIALTPDENSRLEKFLKKEFGVNFRIKLKIDPAVLGGLKIVVGDRMIDQTIAGKLSSILEKIKT